MKRISALFLSLLCLMAMPKSYSQDSIPGRSVKELLNLSLDDFLNVVITPAKVPQSEANITQKVDVLDQQDLSKVVSGNRNICEAISSLPGASVSVLSRNDANWGTYGGIGPKYSTYMLNGLPIDAFIDPMSLDINAIDRIEVQRGPASVIYPNWMSQDFAGNQSPLAGTVNLILKSRIEEQKTLFDFGFGSYNTINTQVFHQGHYKGLNYFFGSSYERSDYTNYGTNGSWLNMKKDPEYSKAKIYGGITLLLKGNDKERITLYYQKTIHNGDAGRIYRGYDNNYATINAGYYLDLSESLHLQSHFGFRSYDRSWQESYFGTIDTLKSENGVSQVIIPADISLSWIQSKKAALSLGADMQGSSYYTWTDPLSGYRSLENKASSLQTGFYAQQELHPIPKLILRGGLRIAFIKNKVTLVSGGAPGDEEVNLKKLLWSTGVRYSITESLYLYANAGTSFAAPGLKSSCGTIKITDFGVPGHNGQLPNPDLKPESGTGMDAGADLKFQSHIKLGIRAFYSNVQDAIVDNIVNQNPSQTKSLNAGSSSVRGGEIELTYKTGPGFSWFANLTYMVSKTQNDLDPQKINISIPFAPRTLMNLGFSYISPFGLTLAPSLNYNSGFYDGVDPDIRKWFKPGIVANAFVSQRLASKETYSVELFTQLSNITDNDYELPWQFKNSGFSFMGGIKVNFGR